MQKEIEIKQSVHDRNEKIACTLNAELTKRGTLCINVMGAPGVGKTSSLLPIIHALEEKSYVIEGDIESQIDTQKLQSLGISACQINTGGACHLDSPLIEKAVDALDPRGGYLFIENIGNLVCPAEFVIGEHIKLLISTMTEGSDKPYKYPLAFEKADIILVNKSDLEHYVDFDREYFFNGVRLLNKSAPVVFVSAKTQEGFGEVVEWISAKKKALISK